jgi:hypothetical protein
VNLIRPLSALVLTSTLAAACHKRPTPPSPPTPPPTASPPAVAEAPPAAVEGPLTLNERLAREAASRPSGALPAETVAAKLSAAGVPIGALKQVLARPLGARYCALARTASGLVVSLCEFDDDAQAARGVDLSRKTFDRFIPGRRLAHRRGTLLTLTLGAPDPTRLAEGARAEAVFTTL